MKVAVVTLCRDRLEYTQRSFASLREYAGCPYDHFVLDQGSQDGSREWLYDEFAHQRIHTLIPLDHNVGINAGLNRLLDLTDRYDLVCNIDNDCELLVPNTLVATVQVAASHRRSSIGPHVQGLNRPPAVTTIAQLSGYRVGITDKIGGLFQPLPRGWRYTLRPDLPLHGDGDCQVARHVHAAGGVTGYLLDYPVMHMDGTSAQYERFPEYYARRVAEGGRAY